MTVSAPPNILTLSDTIHFIENVHLDIEYNEIFIIGFENIAITSLSGQLITSKKLSEGSTVIGQQRTPQGWQYFCRNDSHLINCISSESETSEVELESASESHNTAAWSPCGKYVAVGSIGTTLSVWHTQTGELVMQVSMSWANEEEFINPPSLSVKGWSKTGNEIICIAEVMMTSNVIVWNLKSQKILTIIQ